MDYESNLLPAPELNVILSFVIVYKQVILVIFKPKHIFGVISC